MKRFALAAATSLVLLGLPVRGGELPKSNKPEAVGLSAEKLGEIKPGLQKLVDEGKVAGGVALVSRRGEVAYTEAFGFRDLATKTPMTEDTIFAIASMTKPVTSIAVMILVEQGKLRLDDPVGKYLPELDGLKVLGDAKDDHDDELATVPAKRKVTVRDLLTHTSGISYGGMLATNPRLARAFAQRRVQEPGLPSMAEQVERLAHIPLAHQPGEAWTYGLNHDVLGRVVEVVAKQPYDRFLEERIFGPLDMHDTGFSVPESKRDRVATIYRWLPLGKLMALPKNYGSTGFFSGGGGLFSTVRDYARFAQLLANGGELDGVRIIRRETLDEMTTNHIGPFKAFDRFKYGLGFGLEIDPETDGKAAGPSTYFWGGIYSTYFWIDRQDDVIAVLMTQVLPTNSSGAERFYRSAVEEAIVK